jgi:23S rRNA pseudouridine2605 synthase
MANQTIRLNKYLANLGFISRRNMSDFLSKNVVLINGERVKEIGFRIDTQKDEIILNGERLERDQKLVYFILNKPKKVISTAKDEFGRKTVVDLIKSKERIYPVGRLDENTTGLILLTNDGDLTNLLTHPKFHAPKTYQVTISDQLTDSKKKALESGVNLKEGKTQPAQINILEQNPKRTVLEITIHEGKYHQVRRMFAKLKLNLLDLKRVAIGPLKLGSLELGRSRELTFEEIASLKALKPDG